MTRYRFLDAMGDVVAEADLPDHATALALVLNDEVPKPDDEDDDGDDDRDDDETPQVQRVEFLGPGGDWRWAGALHG